MPRRTVPRCGAGAGVCDADIDASGVPAGNTGIVREPERSPGTPCCSGLNKEEVRS